MRYFLNISFYDYDNEINRESGDEVFLECGWFCDEYGNGICVEGSHASEYYIDVKDS